MEKAKIPTIKMKTDDLASLQADFIAKINDDAQFLAKLKALGLSSEAVRSNLGTLIDFQEDFDYCQQCPGLEKCAKATPHYEMGVTYDGKFLDRKYSPCHRVTERMMMDARYLVRDFPQAWEDDDLRKIDKTQTRNPLIIELSSILAGKSKRWVFTRGKVRSGRTYILACFSNMFAKNVASPVAFCDSSTLVERLKGLSITDKKAFEKEFEALEKAPLLVLDDFGNEFKSDFAFSTLLFPLLNYRSKNDLITMFTSDFTISEIGDMYSQKVAPARGKQLVNLLTSLTEKEFILNGVTVY